MTIQTNAANMISDWVETMLPRFSSQNLGLHIIMRFSYEDMGFDETGNEIVREPWKKNFYIELLFIRPSNYTKVLGRVFESHDFTDVVTSDEQIEMKQFSDHDSCWRTDGFTEFFKTFMKAVNEYSNDHPDGPDLRENLSEFHGLDLFHGKPKYVYVEYAHRKDSDNPWNSDYVVKIERKISNKEAATLMPDDES